MSFVVVLGMIALFIFRFLRNVAVLMAKMNRLWMMGAIDYSSIIGVILLIQIWSRGKIRYMLTLVRRSSSRRRWRRPILVHLIYIFISNFIYTILKQFLSKSYIFLIPSQNQKGKRSDFGYCRIFIKNNYKPMEQTDRNFIDDMTKMIIRPHRDIYTL